MTFLPTLKQLQYLTALHQQGHFGRAAETVNVTQSTLSAGLRELETLLGTVLVERTARVVRFTPLGERIVAKAYTVLREADELARHGRARPGSRSAASCGSASSPRWRRSCCRGCCRSCAPAFPT